MYFSLMVRLASAAKSMPREGSQTNLVVVNSQREWLVEKALIRWEMALKM
jgi:hypothetical protein